MTANLKKSNTSRFARLFNNNLVKIIKHCSEKRTTNLTVRNVTDFKTHIALAGSQNKDTYLFILPPAKGGAESYLNNIAKHMQEYHLILFNNFYLYLKDRWGADYHQDISYEKLASVYIDYIKSIQKEGPYNFLGWSFGGVLALEITRQLLKTNNQVKNLFLIDSYFNYRKAVKENKLNHSEKNDINYKYFPQIGANTWQDLQIILFKASQKMITDKVGKDLSTYYTEKTKDNLLSDILNTNDFQIINIDSTHESWVNSEEQIKKICNQLKTALRGSLFPT